MFKGLAGKSVLVIVSTRADRVMEYAGVVCMEDNDYLKMRDVSINMQLTNMQTSMFGHSTASFYESSLPSVIVNKKYIVSIIEKN